MKLTLASKSSADRLNHQATSERLVNWYALPAPDGGTGAFILRAVPGLQELTRVPGPFLRAMKAVEGKLYVVARGELWRVSETGVTTDLATVDDDPNTAMAGNRDVVTIASGGDYHAWDTSLHSPGSGRITDVGSVEFLDQFTLLTQRDGREVEWTQAGLPLTRNALYFATAESRDDEIVRAVAFGAYLSVFKEKSTEIWAKAGSGASSFAVVQGEVAETGLLAFNLVTKTPKGLFWVGHDKVAYFGLGKSSSPVSIPAVDQAIQAETPTHCFYYEDRGQRFCVIRFAKRPAWVYDAATGLWHERASGINHLPWDIIAAEFVYGKWHLADRNGHIYTLTQTPSDMGHVLRRTLTSQTMPGPVHLNMFEVFGRFGHNSITEKGPNILRDENGFPITTEDGKPFYNEDEQEPYDVQRPARLQARFSQDGGKTWGLWKVRDIGIAGQYNALCRWRAQGLFRRRLTVQIDMTDAVDVPLMSDAGIE